VPGSVGPAGRVAPRADGGPTATSWGCRGRTPGRAWVGGRSCRAAGVSAAGRAAAHGSRSRPVTSRSDQTTTFTAPIRWAISRTPTPRARRPSPPARPPGPPDSPDSRRRAAHGGAGQAGTGLEAGADCRLHGLEDLRAVEARLYHRPRKILGWRTPAEPRLVFLRDGTLLRMDRVGMTSGRPALLIG
jgi:hypothetical protein